ncbi:unnamed protein product [Clavelina lepadiformis]|uniref:Reverse transcriptase n=1 Tax=Clavelina lepadiformis TaxID=159417 RepID=A0ABP0GPN7_CLALP
MNKWGMAPSAACECGAEEQTADHVITSCPTYRHPCGNRGLTTMDENLVMGKKAKEKYFAEEFTGALTSSTRKPVTSLYSCSGRNKATCIMLIIKIL